MFGDQASDRAQRARVGQRRRGPDFGQAAAQHRLSATISAAESPKTSLQPPSSAMMPLAVRATRIPTSRPLITLPTTRPRSRSAASVLASGSRICATTEVTPTMSSAAASRPKLGAAAVAASASAVISRMRVISPAPLEQVAERDQQHEPRRVADLRGRHEQTGGAVGDREFVRDRAEQRLGVVDVRDGRPAADCRRRPRRGGQGPSARSSHGEIRTSPRGPRAESQRSPAVCRPALWAPARSAHMSKRRPADAGQAALLCRAPTVILQACPLLPR